MGYNIYIGNAVPHFDKSDFPYLECRLKVEGVENQDAPDLPNDTMTGKCNSRFPGYGAWTEFTKAVGLYEFFFNKDNGLMVEHPGVVGLTKDDADLVTDTLNRYRSTATLPPGFEAGWEYNGPPNYDYNLARLMWLEFWIRWAVENCETPAISNG